MPDNPRTAKPPNPSPDPFAMWREWVTKSEHQMNAMLNEAMGTDEFARASGSWIEAMTMFQQTMNENSQRYFQMAGVPTRTDIGELAERLTAVEERLQRIEALLATAIGRRDVPGQAVRPVRTRRPPSEQGSAEQPPAAAQLVDAVPAGADAASGNRETESK